MVIILGLRLPQRLRQTRLWRNVSDNLIQDQSAGASVTATPAYKLHIAVEASEHNLFKPSKLALGTHSYSIFYREMFSFQTPRLFERLGYTIIYEKVYPHGIIKFVIFKHNQNAA
jgi:hypothetical protein